MARHLTFAVSLLAAFAVACNACVFAAPPVRIATFNLALYGEKSDDVINRLRGGDDPQARCLAEIIQRTRPDVILLNEIDYEANDAVLKSFCDEYLAVAQDLTGAAPDPAQTIHYQHHFTAPVNTGVHSGFDLDKSGDVNAAIGSRPYAGDCWGYGRYPGQYGMAVLSRFPIDAEGVRTFQKFKWKDMPGARLPDDDKTPQAGDWYSEEILATFPLSSKSHWDIPILINGKRIHLLASHPTPPVFDGDEDRNGRRNHDEIRFWVDYTALSASPPSGPANAPPQGSAAGGPAAAPTAPAGDDPSTVVPEPKNRDDLPAVTSTPGAPPTYIYDDDGRHGPLSPGESFIILGDLNGDPHDGQGVQGITALLSSPALLPYPAPRSPGGIEQARLQGGANLQHRGDPAQDTADSADDPAPGNLRIDYVLPSRDLKVVAAGVFWPPTADPLYALLGDPREPASSDHRLVWIDLAW